MEQELKYKNIAVIGCGAAGGMACVLLVKNPCLNVTAFDIKEPFTTLLPTGGGRCNLTYDEEDVREFVKNYPRGEKFLLSVFSKFDQKQTRKLFYDLGVKTYVQKDKRVFPVSDSSAKTIQVLRKHLETDNFIFKKKKVISLKKDGLKYVISTESGKYNFDAVIIATGGRVLTSGTPSNEGKNDISGFSLAKQLGHNIVELKPSLTALDISEKNFYNLAGLSFRNAEISFSRGKKKSSSITGDILFAHKAITGPIVFKVSALTAYEEISSQNPLELTLKLTDVSKDTIENEIKTNSKKTIKNVFSKFAPECYINEILIVNKLDGSKQAAQLKKNEKEILIKSLLELKLHATGRIKDSEIVTAGGIDLKEIDSKTMESKLMKGLFFIGEVLNIDGFTGGFNLQNCWSGAYIVSTNFN